MPSTKGKLHALIDGDILIFRAGMAGQYFMRSAYLPEVPECPLVKLRYKKDLVEWLSDNDLTLDDVEIETTQVIEPLPIVLHTVKLMANKMLEQFGEVTMFFSDGGNFREDVATEIPYKGNRWSEEKREAAHKAGKWTEWLAKTDKSHRVPNRPHWEKEIKAYLKRNYSFISITDQEADDALGIAQIAGKRKTCIVSIDKDLKMIQGYHLNMADMDERMTLVKPFEAELNFYGQLLTGDSTDNIPGIKGIGKVTRDRLLEPGSTAKELMGIVWDTYTNHYPTVLDKDITKMVLERGQLLWIRRKEEEMWKPPISLSTHISTQQQASSTKSSG